MQLKKKGPSGRAKRWPLAARGHDDNDPFLRWEPLLNAYTVCVEFKSNTDGSTYTLVGHQIEWEDLARKVEKAFEEAHA